VILDATQKSPWEFFAPTSPIEFYTLVLAIATIGLWIFTWRMARSARDTVKSFVEVERADIVLTLQAFHDEADSDYDVETGTVTQKNERLTFDVLAHNLGRSAALVTAYGLRWCKESEEPGVFLCDTSAKIVPASGVTSLRRETILYKHLPIHDRAWIMLKTQSPLRGELVIQYRFKVYDHRGVSAERQYVEESREEFKPSERKQRNWWRWLAKPLP
jgi:uncharacterized protein YcfL